MKTLTDLTRTVRTWPADDGQELIECALLMGILALAVVATFPELSAGINRIFTTVTEVLNQQSASGLAGL